MSGNGAMPPVWWQLWQRSWRIHSTVPVNVGVASTGRCLSPPVAGGSFDAVSLDDEHAAAEKPARATRASVDAAARIEVMRSIVAVLTT